MFLDYSIIENKVTKHLNPENKITVVRLNIYVPEIISIISNDFFVSNFVSKIICICIYAIFKLVTLSF